MNKLSTGADSTLGNWKKLWEVTFGPGPALDYLNRKIRESPDGENEEVITSEYNMMLALITMQKPLEG
jgi:hypothetical protein